MSRNHTTLYTNQMSTITLCGKPILYQFSIEGGFEVPSETLPTEGKHDYKTCAECIKSLEKLNTILKDKFEGKHIPESKPFPMCCTGHAQLIKIPQFHRKDFTSIPEMVANKVIYTNNHIQNFHESENYFKEITDYISYTVDSFGKMPKNSEPLFLSDYFNFVKQLINSNEKIEKIKKEKIFGYIDSHYTKNRTSTDINILISTYEKWLRLFPFEISFFKKIKAYFENNAPLFNGEEDYNKYSKSVSLKFHTKDTLIDSLLSTTDKLLCEFNTSILFEKGELTEPEKLKMELILNERKIKLKEGYFNQSQNEDHRFRTILKEWFADEKRFIEEITPLLLASSKEPVVTKADLFKIELQQLGFYNLEKVKKLTPENQDKIVDLIALKPMAYGIAMFDYLKFTDFLDNEKGAKEKANLLLSKLFNPNAKDGTQARHYRNSLITAKQRYTSYLHKETVKKDYETLK